MISHIDFNVGRLLDRLDAQGLDDNTIVIHSDHGDRIGNRQLIRKSDATWDLMNIPMLIRGPGIKAGSVFNEPSQHEDVLPTIGFLSISDENIPASNAGQSAKYPYKAAVTGRVSTTTWCTIPQTANIGPLPTAGASSAHFLPA